MLPYRIVVARKKVKNKQTPKSNIEIQLKSITIGALNTKHMKIL